jgi:hypothetical protein
MKRLWKYSDIATLLDTSEAAVRNRVHRQGIPFIRLSRCSVRFDPARIASWLADREGLTASACCTTNLPATSASTATSKTAKSGRAGKQANPGAAGARNFKKTAGGPGRNGQ